MYFSTSSASVALPGFNWRLAGQSGFCLGTPALRLVNVPSAPALDLVIIEVAQIQIGSICRLCSFLARASESALAVVLPQRLQMSPKRLVLLQNQRDGSPARQNERDTKLVWLNPGEACLNNRQLWLLAENFSDDTDSHFDNCRTACPLRRLRTLAEILREV